MALRRRLALPPLHLGHGHESGTAVIDGGVTDLHDRRRGQAAECANARSTSVRASFQSATG
jgi:hypothetical protein